MSVDSIGGDGRWSRRPTDRLTDAFYPVYRWAFDENGSFVTDLERKLAEARMDRTVGLYLAQALAFGILAGAGLWLVGLALGFLVFGTGLVEVTALTGMQVPNETLLAVIEAGRVPFLVVTSGGVAGVVGFAAVFGTYVALPYARAGKREREIDLLMPDAVAFMYALSVGGMSQVEIIEAMAEAEDTYGEVSREFRTILQETTYFETDYRSAIRTRASETPSTELSQFLTDMLSIIDSGGSMTDFLSDKKDVHFRSAREQRERILESLELISEMYITLSIFPLLLIIVLVIMSMMGGPRDLLLYATVYGMIPIMGMMFLVLVSTIRQDEFGDGYLELENDDRPVSDSSGSGPLDLGFVERFTGTYYVFDRIRSREWRHELRQVLERPHHFFRENPFATLAVTLPATVAVVVGAILTGSVPLSWSGVVAQPVWSTVVYLYVPLYLVCLPLSAFWEWNLRSRRAILTDLSENLRKLASANATGLTLIESIRVVAETTPGKLGEEFAVLHAKSNYGMALTESLVVFNNTYHLPRLARTVKLIGKAQEISSEISPVLATAAKGAETQEDIERDRKSRARMQVAIIVMTFLTLLGVMAVMKMQFVDVMAELVERGDGTGDIAGQGFGGAVDTDQLSLLFFHAVALQAIISGFVCGYIREANLTSGLKYVLALSTVTLTVWVVVV